MSDSKKLKIALEIINLIDKQNRTRGYPTAKEWNDLVKRNRELLTAIDSD
jgi:hypothetical protein